MCFVLPQSRRLAVTLLCVGLGALPGHADEAILERELTLPRTSLARFAPEGGPAFDLAAARRNGLAHTDLPSIGSGLEINAAGEWFGLSDRGPNSLLTGPDGQKRRVLPLPDFAPGIAHFRTNRRALELVRYLPLRDATGQPLTGRGNTVADEPGFPSVPAAQPLPPHALGVDLEALRCLPSGEFLIAEEYGPSLLLADTNGVVRWRLIPEGHRLPDASYAVHDTLPAAVRARRVNRGFENLALSPDGRTAYLALQSPAFPAEPPGAAASRIVRVIEVDLSQLESPRVTGHFLARAGAPADHAGTTDQTTIKWNDAVWLAPRQLLVLEQARQSAALVLVDLNQASNLLGLPGENDSRLDAEDLDSLAHLRVAEGRRWLGLRAISERAGHKLEGLARLGPDRFALINDNDFGIGENERRLPTRVWIIRAPSPALSRLPGAADTDPQGARGPS